MTYDTQQTLLCNSGSRGNAGAFPGFWGALRCEQARPLPSPPCSKSHREVMYPLICPLKCYREINFPEHVHLN